MITLGIDTSLSTVSFAIVKDSKIVAEFNGDIGRNLADNIGEITRDLLEKAKISVKNIDRCGIVVGPGSFTGLRIGIAFAKGLFADTNAEIAAVSSLECAAKTLCGNAQYNKTGEIAVFLDARQDEVFFAKFEKKENGDFIRKSADERVLFDTAIEKCAKNNAVVYSFSGNNNSLIKQVLQKFESFEAETLVGRGAVAAKIAETSENLQTIDEIFPNYMQVSYAERCKK